jgi:protein O-mannosyl-transferase
METALRARAVRWDNCGDMDVAGEMRTDLVAGKLRDASWRLGPFDLLWALLLLVLVLAIYWPVRSFDWIDLDDGVYLFENPQVLAGLTLAGTKWAFITFSVANWHPLAWLSWMADVQIFGPKPGPIHFENAVIHGLNTAGWYLLLASMTGRRGRSAAVAALFGLHPMHVESVAWISERKDVLSVFMLIVSLGAYCRYARSNRPLPYVTSLAAYLLGLMCKPLVITQPCLMLLLDFWPLRRWSPGADTSASTKAIRPSRLVVEKIPFLMLAAASAALTFLAEHDVGGAADLQQLDAGHRLANAMLGYIRYLGKAVWPTDLAVLYPYKWDYPVGVVITGCALLVFFTIIAIRGRRRLPYITVGWFWFIGTLIPMIGLVQVGKQAIADRYTYLPYVGLFIAAVWAVGNLIKAAAGIHRTVAAAVSTTVTIAVVCAFTLLTIRQIPLWQNSITLFSHAEEVADPSSTIEYGLGSAYLRKGRPDLAIEHYDQAVQLNPNDAPAQSCLGNLLMPYSSEMALPHLTAAVRIKPDDPLMWYYLGVCLEKLGRSQDAVAEFHRALDLKPDFPEAAAALHAISAPKNL